MTLLQKRATLCLCLCLSLLILLSGCGGTATTDGDLPDSSATPAVTADGAGGTQTGEQSGATIAARVGDVDITLQEFNYHYLTAFFWFVDYGYASMLGITEAAELNEVKYDDETTWAQIFAEDTMSSLRSVVAESEAAKALGLTLSADGLAELEDMMNSARDQAIAGEQDMDTYLSDTFGEGMTESVYRACIERIIMADEWVAYIEKDVDVSDTALDSYYQAHREDFDVVDFNAFYLKGALYDENGNIVEGDEQTAYLAEQESRAKEMLSRLNGDNFKEIAADYLDEGETAQETLAQGVTLANLSAVEGLTEFMTDPARVPGDAKLFFYEDGWYVIQYLDLYLPDSYTIDVRHILISLDTENARTIAEDLYRQWQEGDATEESFALLAGLYTEDPGSQSTGGLYEGVEQGQMVASFDAWCFDKARKPGDTGIVETDYGYHIMYFVGRGSPSWKQTVKETLLSAVTTEARNALAENITTEMYDVLEYVGK